MEHRRRVAAAALAAALPLAACAGPAPSLGEASNGAVRVEPVEGSPVSKVTLTPEARDRLGIATAQVRQATGSGLVLPSAALLYDAEGRTWTYVVQGEGSYVRAAVDVDHIEGASTYLTDGPAAGTPVVVVGVPELYGAEEGVDGE